MNATAVVRASPTVQLPLLRSHSAGIATSVSATFADNLAVECRNLSYSVRTRKGNFVPILNDCSLSIPSGQFWMLLGPNGCGKSTLLKVYTHFTYMISLNSCQLFVCGVAFARYSLLSNISRSFLKQNVMLLCHFGGNGKDNILLIR